MSLYYCSLASGSSGNCHFISSKKAKILLDAGMSRKYIRDSLEAIGENIEDIDGIFITHEHSDHIKGLKVILKNYDIIVHMSERVFENIKDKFREEDLCKIEFISSDEELVIKDIKIKSFKTSHDSVDPMGYNFLYKDKKLSIVTDVGIMTDEIIESLRNSNFLVIESNHDVNMLMYGAYPFYLKKRILSEVGHLSNDAAAETVYEIFKDGKLKNVVLAHLSKENNVPELAHLTVQRYLESMNVSISKDLNLDLTYRDKVSKLYRIV